MSLSVGVTNTVDLEGAIKEHISNLSNQIDSFNKTLLNSASRLNNLILDQKQVTKAFDNIRSHSDILLVYPSYEKVIKINNDLNKIATASNLDLNDYQHLIFVQKFYKFFYRSNANGVKKANKESLLTDKELIRDVKAIYDLSNGEISDEVFKSIVKIFKLKIENGIDQASKLVELYNKHSLVKRNIEKIALIHIVGSENGFSFEFVQSNLLTLLEVAYLSKKSQKDIKLNIEKALENLKENSEVSLKNILQSHKKIENTNIKPELVALFKVIVGNAKTSQLSHVKSFFGNFLTKNFLNKINSFKYPTILDSHEFNILLEKLHSNIESVKFEINSLLN